MSADSVGRSDLMRWIAVQEQAHQLRRAHPDWRWGQTLFNALHGMDPELADQIRGTFADPFNDGSPSRIALFGDAVMRGLGNPS